MLIMANFTVPNFVDIFLIFILFATALKYRKKGFVTAIVELLGTTVAAISAFIFSTKMAPVVFERFFKAAFSKQVTEKLSQAASTMLTNDVIKDILNFLPADIVDIFMSENGILNSMVNPNAPGVALEIVEEIISPLVTPLISVIMFFIILVVVKLVLGFVASVLQKINVIPGVGTVNKWLGFAAGIVVGFVNVYIIVVALSAVAILTGNQLPILQTEFIQASFFGGIFKAFNPFR